MRYDFHVPGWKGADGHVLAPCFSLALDMWIVRLRRSKRMHFIPTLFYTTPFRDRIVVVVLRFC